MPENKKENMKTEAEYTKYEVARIVGARALQISMGAPVLVKVPKALYDSIDIAKFEFDQGATPLTIKRIMPYGGAA
ncbi:MAG: DNA-directed RNA polymerase subunit K [archaeon]